METGLTSWQPPVEVIEQSQQQEQAEEEPEAPPVQDDEREGEKDPENSEDRSSKRRKASTSQSAKEVRVLHILKKHKDSRRPSSWRQPVIRQTVEEATDDLKGLLEILQEEEGNLDELRATFEELARTESDCSSAKRGGDLGFFGRRKMQPAFEAASFDLKVGEMTKDIVETSSGVHLILRIG
jgi:NIMA-interacting peptidyl-prolyl cis-trans isomerase 1